MCWFIPSNQLRRQQWSVLKVLNLLGNSGSLSTEPLSHGTKTLWCLQKEIATYRRWSVSLWQEPDDVPHCRILQSSDEAEWRLVPATLDCRRRCFVADQLWFITCIEKKKWSVGNDLSRWSGFWALVILIWLRTASHYRSVGPAHFYWTDGILVPGCYGAHIFH